MFQDKKLGIMKRFDKYPLLGTVHYDDRFDGIDNPDAIAIAAAPEDVRLLIADLTKALKGWDEALARIKELELQVNTALNKTCSECGEDASSTHADNVFSAIERYYQDCVDSNTWSPDD